MEAEMTWEFNPMVGDLKFPATGPEEILLFGNL